MSRSDVIGEDSRLKKERIIWLKEVVVLVTTDVSSEQDSLFM